MGRHHAVRGGACVQQRRARRAALIVLAACVAMMLLLGAAERAPAARAGEAGTGDTLVDRLLDGASLADAMEEAGFVTVDEHTVPAWFAQEIMPFARVRECYASSDLSAVFLSVSRGADESFAALRALFEEQGWVAVTDDEGGMLALMKDGGTCRWMTVNAQETETGWDAALRIQLASSEREGLRRAGDGS